MYRSLLFKKNIHHYFQTKGKVVNLKYKFLFGARKLKYFQFKINKIKYFLGLELCMNFGAKLKIYGVLKYIFLAVHARI